MDIIFRGYNNLKGWIYGSYATDFDDYHAILQENKDDQSTMLNTPIDIKSLGQFLGIKDNNSATLYTGDICEVDGVGVCKVGMCRYYGAIFIDADGNEFPVIDSLSEGDNFKIIGNSFENPELLESSNE